MKRFLLALAIASPLFLAAQPTLFFQIANGQTVGSQYEFDILGSCSQPGSYHTRGLIYISYNSLAFGPNIVTNARFSYTKGPLLNQVVALPPPNNVDKYSILGPVDNASNIIAITWVSNLNIGPSPTFLTEVPTTPALLLHCVIQFVNTLQAPQVAFVSNLMAGQQFYSTGPNAESPYQDGFILPATLTHFSARALHDNAAELRWTSSQEYGLDQYVVEKSADGLSFQDAGAVKATGAGEYRYADYSPMAALNYFRLRIVDLDGAYTYSNVVQLGFGQQDTRWTLFPQPAAESVWLQHPSAEARLLRYHITDVAGRTISTGEWAETPAGAYHLSLQGLSAGHYTLRCMDAQGKSVVFPLLRVAR